MLEVFMLQASLEIGRTKEDPTKWAREFVSKLTERIDSNEARFGDSRYPSHELARKGFDRLGEALDLLLKTPS